MVRPGGQIQLVGYLVTPQCELTVEASEFADVSGRCQRAPHLWWSVVIDERVGIPSMVVWRTGGRLRTGFGGLGDRIL